MFNGTITIRFQVETEDDAERMEEKIRLTVEASFPGADVDSADIWSDDETA